MTPRRQREKFTAQPTVPMTSTLLMALEQIAEKDKITRSELMRRLLADGVARRLTTGAHDEQRDTAAA